MGQRLDKFLAKDEFIQTRSRASKLIQNQQVLVNNQTVKPSYCIEGNEIIVILLPEEQNDCSLKPLSLDLDIVYEDSDLLVINKPSGLVVHPACGHQQDTLVNALLYHTSDLSMKFNEKRPGIVHRIDKETSGLLVVAKNDQAHSRLSKQFKNKTIHRIYHALCYGLPKNKLGTLNSFLCRHPHNRKKISSLRDEQNKIIRDLKIDGLKGKPAITHYQVLSHYFSQFSYLTIKLETGRTHQIRVHLSEIGHPLIGDSVYGGDKRENSIENSKIKKEIQSLNRFCLHATELGFSHPTTLKSMIFKVGWPKDVQTLISLLGFESYGHH